MYFQNFYAFRFFAAMAIVVLHVELMARRFGWIKGAMPTAIEVLSLGVDFFFVLSGFLITSLILKDGSTNRSRLGRFYVRRALRILPLYYLVVLVVFVVTPMLGFPRLPGMPLERDYGTQLTLHLLLLPHVAKSYLSFVPYGGQLWTIGVEVMFYAFWPLLLMMWPTLSAVIVSIFLWVSLKASALVLLGSTHPVSTFLAMSRFEVLATGGAAFLIFRMCIDQNAGVRRTKLRGRVVQILHCPRKCMALLLMLLVLTSASWIWLDDAVHLVAGCLFAMLLIASCLGYFNTSLLENRAFAYLGEISYGIYLWHFLAIGAVYRLADYLQFVPGDTGFWIFAYGSSIALTLAASMLSFLLIEKPVNALRHQF